MKTVQEKIAVMQAYADGAKLELKWLDRADSKWVDVVAHEPHFDWRHCDYRIKEDQELKAFNMSLEVCRQNALCTDQRQWMRKIINAVKAGEIT